MTGVGVSAGRPRGMISFKADLAGSSAGFAVTKAIGAALPDTGHATGSGDAAVLWMAPDELLVLCPHDAADRVLGKITSAMGEAHFLAADVSGARVGFSLTGGDAMVREVLARLTPADMDPARFKVGQVRRTRLSQVAGAIWMTEYGAEVFVFRSVADYVHDLLTNAAASAPVGHF